MKTQIMKKIRINEITNLRALAILLVVFGHSIVLYSHLWTRYTSIYEVDFLDRLKTVINMIQMPLYFSISGFLFMGGKRKSFPEFLKSRVLRLLVPCVCVSWGWMIPIRYLVNYNNYRTIGIRQILHEYLTGTDDGHLWFLPCLFTCMVVSYIYKEIAERVGLSPLIAELIMLVVSFGLLRKAYLLPPVGLIKDPAKQLFYFHYGCLIRVIWLQFRSFKWLRPVAGIVCAGCILLEWFHPLSIYSLFYQALIVLTIGSLYALVPGEVCRGTRVLADYSFGLYLFHSPLIYITFTYLLNAHPAIVVSINFFVCGTIAFLITWVLKRSPLCFIIGEARK